MTQPLPTNVAADKPQETTATCPPGAIHCSHSSGTRSSVPHPRGSEDGAPGVSERPSPLPLSPGGRGGISAPAANGNDLFLKNMRQLWRFDPALAMEVDAVFDDERVPVERARSGGWTAQLATAGGQAIYLHSRHDPEAEAKAFADAVPLDDKFCVVVSGLGLGYHVQALYRRLTGEAVIVCSEPSIPLIASALSCVDLSDAIASRRFILLTDADKNRLHQRLQPFNTLIMLGAQFVAHAPSVRANPQAHAAVREALTEFITYTRMTLMTLVANSRIPCRNIAMNLVHYVSTPSVDILRDRFRGCPGVVISAGPSLRRNMDQLAELQGRAVFVAVQTALRPLAERGITPDFVTSLDFHEMSRKFFEGIPNLDRVHLVAEPKATWVVLDDYPGPVSLLNNDWARLVIGDELGNRGGLPAGATVAHLAFYLAVFLGCDPIIFVGQDLAFTGHAFYVPGVEIHGAWRSELNRFHSLEHKEWERIVRNRPILRTVTGNDGRELYTDELLFTYLEQFEKDIAAVAARVINATEGGARIRGTETMTLREVAERYCAAPIDRERFAYRDSECRRDPSRWAPTRDELETRITELDAAERNCEELLRLLEELTGLVDDPDRFNRRLIRVDELRTKVQRESRAYQVINFATQMAEFRRFSADRRISAAELEERERAKRQIVRDTEFVTAVREGAIDCKEILSDALERIEEAMERP